MQQEKFHHVMKAKSQLRRHETGSTALPSCQIQQKELDILDAHFLFLRSAIPAFLSNTERACH